MWRLVDASTCSPLPSSGYRGRPLREPCGSPPSSVLWARKTARLPVAATSGFPWQQVSARRGFVRFPWGSALIPGDLVELGLGQTDAQYAAEAESSPGFTGSPFGSMPRARDSGDSGQPRGLRLPGCSLPPGLRCRRSQRSTISELILTACFLTMYASHPPVTRRMATLATGLPATALTGLDLHQLDFNKRFH